MQISSTETHHCPEVLNMEEPVTFITVNLLLSVRFFCATKILKVSALHKIWKVDTTLYRST